MPYRSSPAWFHSVSLVIWPVASLRPAAPANRASSLLAYFNSFCISSSSNSPGTSR